MAHNEMKVAFLSFLITASLSTVFAANELVIVHNGSVQGVLGKESGGVQAKTVTYISELRKGQADRFLLLSCGNMLGPSVTSHIDGGALSLDLMNRCHYDAMAVGPHDLFAGVENFSKQLRKARFPFVCSNFQAKGDLIKSRTFSRVKRIVRLRRAKREIAILGFIEPEAIKNWPQWPAELELQDPVEMLKEMKDRRKGADITVVMGTMSFKRAVKLLEDFPWIDAIFAHPAAGENVATGSTFVNQLLDGRILIWSACHGSHLARLVTAPPDAGMTFFARALKVKETIVDEPRALSDINKLEAEARVEKGEVIANLTETERQNYGRTLLNALRCELGAEIGIIHKGALRHQEVPAKITKRVLGVTFPFPDRVALIEVDGATLETIWQQRDKKLINDDGLEIVGMGMSCNRPAVNGRPINANEKYRVATTEFLALGGLDLLPRTPAAVRPQRLVDTFAEHFARYSDVERLQRHRRVGRRPIRRASTNLDASFNKLSFDGSAGTYQYSDPNAIYTGSDIPGLSGNAHRQYSWNLHHKNVIDWPEADLTFDLKLNYTNFNNLKLIDRSSFDIIYEDQSRECDKPHLYGAINLAGTVLNPDVEGKDHPLFAKTQIGLVWQTSPSAKIFAGGAHLYRLSVPGDPDNFGLNFRYELSHEIRKDVTFSTNLDFFSSFDSDDIRTFDWTSELRLKLHGRLSTVARYTSFIWLDDVVKDTASRQDLYFGLGYSLPFRRF